MHFLAIIGTVAFQSAKNNFRLSASRQQRSTGGCILYEVSLEGLKGVHSQTHLNYSGWFALRLGLLQHCNAAYKVSVIVEELWFSYYMLHNIKFRLCTSNGRDTTE